MDEETPRPPDVVTMTVGRRLLTAYLAFGIAVGIPGLAYGVLYVVLLALDDNAGEGWGLLAAQALGFLVAVIAAFVLHVVVARRLRLGWVQGLAVIPLAITGVVFAGFGWWPGTDQPFWTILTALAAPAVIGLLTVPGLARRAR